MKIRDSRPGPDSVDAAFTRRDLMAVLSVIGLLGLLWLPAVGRENDDSDRAVCLSNVRRILAAVAMYASDNGDALPHPSWGSLSGDPGADNWCYAARLPDGRQIPSAAGRGGPQAHEVQMPFYVASQLARYLDSQRTLMCPTDWAQAMTSAAGATWYRSRQLKLTSYTMNGAVCGYGGTAIAGAVFGATHKLAAFSPSDILLWEPDETDPFNFNDAGSNPWNSSEGLSLRHTGQLAETLVAGAAMDAVIGRFGGAAEFVPLSTLSALAQSPRPNELLCGPGYE